jgi:hypothetical protein
MKSANYLINHKTDFDKFVKYVLPAFEDRENNFEQLYQEGHLFYSTKEITGCLQIFNSYSMTDFPSQILLALEGNDIEGYSGLHEILSLANSQIYDIEKIKNYYTDKNIEVVQVGLYSDVNKATEMIPVLAYTLRSRLKDESIEKELEKVLMRLVLNRDYDRGYEK